MPVIQAVGDDDLHSATHGRGSKTIHEIFRPVIKIPQDDPNPQAYI